MRFKKSNLSFTEIHVYMRAHFLRSFLFYRKGECAVFEEYMRKG